MKMSPWTTAHGEDGPPQRLADITAPVANVYKMPDRNLVQVQPLITRTDHDPAWITKFLAFIEQLNADIQSGTPFPSRDQQKVAPMEEFTIPEQIEIVGRFIRSKMKGLTELRKIAPADILEQ